MKLIDFGKKEFMKVNEFAKKEKYLAILFCIFVLVFAVFSIVKPDMFLLQTNLESMAFQFPEYGIMALGVMLAMISGGIDLSIVAVANFSAIIAVMIMKKIAEIAPEATIAGIFLAIAAAIIVGWLVGFFNGTLVARLKVPAILATLGTMQMLTGISVVLTKGKALNGVPPIYSETGNTPLFGFLPIPLILFIICFALVAFLVIKTVYGASLYAVGANLTAAKFSAVNYKKIISNTYALSGALSAVSGLIMISAYNSAKPDYGSAYMLQCVLIVILGGVSPTGGIGKVWGVLMAILTLQMVSSGMNMFNGLNVHYRSLVWGMLLLGMMVYTYFENNKKIGLNKPLKVSPAKGE